MTAIRHMCLCSPSSINWYRHRLGTKQALHVTHSFDWCLAEGYWNGGQRHPIGHCGSGRTLALASHICAIQCVTSVGTIYVIQAEFSTQTSLMCEQMSCRSPNVRTLHFVKTWKMHSRK